MIAAAQDPGIGWLAFTFAWTGLCLLAAGASWLADWLTRRKRPDLDLPGHERLGMKNAPAPRKRPGA